MRPVEKIDAKQACQQAWRDLSSSQHHGQALKVIPSLLEIELGFAQAEWRSMMGDNYTPEQELDHEPDSWGSDVVIRSRANNVALLQQAQNPRTHEGLMAAHKWFGIQKHAAKGDMEDSEVRYRIIYAVAVPLWLIDFLPGRPFNRWVGKNIARVHEQGTRLIRACNMAQQAILVADQVRPFFVN